MNFNDFLSVVDLIKDVDKYKKQVEELVTREKAIDAAYDKLNLGNNIAKVSAKAEADRADAADLLIKAENEAVKIRSDAKDSYAKQLANLAAREVVVQEESAKYNAIKASWAERERDLNARTKSLNALQEQLETRQTAINDSQTEVADRLQKLRSAMGG